jgi:hypothetical protein
MNLGQGEWISPAQDFKPGKKVGSCPKPVVYSPDNQLTEGDWMKGEENGRSSHRNR